MLFDESDFWNQPGVDPDGKVGLVGMVTPRQILLLIGKNVFYARVHVVEKLFHRQSRVNVTERREKLDAALEMTHTTEQQWQAFVKASKK